MENNLQQKLIDDIVEDSKELDAKLQSDIVALVNICHEQNNQIIKLKKENNFFLKKWDMHNILIHQRDAKKDKIIEQQSRLAAMGEMIDAIAHQWKQPLNAISMLVELLKIDFNNHEVDSKYINVLEQTVQLQINHMVNTLAEFRNFLRPSTKDESFYIHTILSNVLVLMKDELISQNIHLQTNFDHEMAVYGNKNEFKHLFINLINNSIDAFNEKNILKKEIYVRCYGENKSVYLEVEDNAGGIPEYIIADIFKPNVTTKAEGKGTGIGLYMCKQIVKKNNGSINVHNSTIGAFFTIILPQATTSNSPSDL